MRFTTPFQSNRYTPRGSVFAVVVASLILGGCQSRTASLDSDNLSTASTSSPESGMSFKRTEALSKSWEKSKGDPKVGLSYAAELGKMGQTQTQVEVLRQVAASNSDKANVQFEVGKQLIALNAMEQATPILERAVQLDPNNWQAQSALGSAYDQASRHGEAREHYNLALAQKPDAVGVRNNLAMSYALQNQLPEAESRLRELMSNGKGSAMPRVRQNLALVVGLQGRFDEARKIASEDLPPDQVDANLAYLQQMLAQPNTWKQLQEG
jgi:Flp pilus assembly protein TadD